MGASVKKIKKSLDNENDSAKLMTSPRGAATSNQTKL
jgi:hypothetical protein